MIHKVLRAAFGFFTSHFYGASPGTDWGIYLAYFRHFPSHNADSVRRVTFSTKLIDCTCKCRLLDFVLAHGEPVLCRYAPNPRSPGLVPGFFSARSQQFQASVTSDSHATRIIENYFLLSLIMAWLSIFLGVWPIALGLLLAFAARIDPRSGRWRRRSR
ncbi:hypothetical protein PQR67_06460 [Paraburkholderia fungorum]|uniref:hypothetical protein n=1 Tax=Paraburkholderia fungorum TaxID=134537 RepID=UPI0038B6B9A1